MRTFIESPLFSKLWPDYWTEDQRSEFATWISENPDAGDVISRSGGCRKVRWSREGQGKQGGTRVVYIIQLANGAIVLLLIYAKSARDTIPAHVLRRIVKEMNDATE
ncbi:MAG: transcriptional regulator [Synechococcaceae cyanobacterium SM1_2_3]|nr:transcriptional regulator [Synechococcaceae cyanobacterium SM1_2_3]